MAAALNPGIDAGAAVLPGADLNINVGNCDETQWLDPLYYGRFGRGAVECDYGYGRFWESDEYRSGGDGIYDEKTYVTDSGVLEKIDYVLINTQRFSYNYGADSTGSGVSDHEPLRASVTVHD